MVTTSRLDRVRKALKESGDYEPLARFRKLEMDGGPSDTPNNPTTSPSSKPIAHIGDTKIYDPESRHYSKPNSPNLYKVPGQPHFLVQAEGNGHHFRPVHDDGSTPEGMDAYRVFPGREEAKRAAIHALSNPYQSLKDHETAASFHRGAQYALSQHDPLRAKKHERAARMHEDVATALKDPPHPGRYV